jgi:hypothetical protein
MMRREFSLTLVALALLALTACSTEHEVNIPAPQGDEISFGTVNTRAGVSDLQANGFGVWAFIDNTNVQDYVLMDNQQVTCTDGVWTYSPHKYWIKNTVFTFMATYPYDSAGDNFTVDTANKAIKLAVSETPSQVDFLIAQNETDTSIEGYSTKVDLQFKHMLTSVGLNIWRDGGKHQNDEMRIKSVTLGNIRKGGTYSTDTNTWTYDGNKLTVVKEYDNLSDTDNIGAVIVKDDGTLDSGGDKAASPFGDMMLLPQTLDDSNVVSLKIVYELKRQNAADWEVAELETVLPSITWNAGQRYTYNVVLSSVTDITVYYIQTKVDPWGTPQVGGTVIIK